jgi:hypothetical protein
MGAMRGILPIAAVAVLGLVGCGRNRDLPPPPPLGPELYEIDADDRPHTGQFLRFVEPGPRGGGLDIAVTDFAPPKDGPTVHLFGVVHVADEHYYARVQRELDGYDVVLYEGVKDAALTGVEWQRNLLERGGDAGLMQQDLAEWFGFQYQLAAIDYGRPSFLHADMSTAEFDAAGADKFGLGSSSSSREMPAAVRTTWEGVRRIGRLVLGQPGPIQSLARRQFAETMGTQDIGGSLDLAPGLAELLLVKRNAVVMERLDALRPATPVRTVAIFYGAAHMVDLAARLASRGYVRTGGHWLRAWALRPPLG